VIKRFHEGSSYSALNTARSALSPFLVLFVEDKRFSVGEHPVVKRLMKKVLLITDQLFLETLKYGMFR
jgi:hypothetical protein